MTDLDDLIKEMAEQEEWDKSHRVRAFFRDVVWRVQWSVKENSRPSIWVWRLKMLTVHPYQRIRYGYSFNDLWQFDSHVAKIFTKALPEFKEAFCTHEDSQPMRNDLSEMAHFFENYDGMINPENFECFRDMLATTFARRFEELWD